MPGTFNQAAITVVASKEGYSPETWSRPAYSRPVEGSIVGFSFRLAPLAPSANLAGECTLTLTANNGCTQLSEEARARVYTASIVSRWRATTFVGTLSDARIVLDTFWSPYFQIEVANDFANTSPIRRATERWDLSGDRRSNSGGSGTVGNHGAIQRALRALSQSARMGSGRVLVVLCRRSRR